MKFKFFTLSLMLTFLAGLAQAGTIQYITDTGVVNFAAPVSVPLVVQEEKKPAPAPKKKPKKSLETIITEAQKKYGIERALIKAVIKAESGFNAQAVSDKGARGHMQIMPTNYKALGITDPHDPEQNIKGGTKYLKELLLRYDRRLDLALAAYNAGPQAVEKYGKVPPYPETLKYVNKVIRYYKAFKKA